MRRGYTLIEIIITIAITGILSVGMFKAFEAITLRSEKAKILTALSIDSQSALDQLSLLLYDRAPMSVKSCTNENDCVVMDGIMSGTIVQWYSTASESYQAGAYSGFVDMNRSVNPNLYTPNTIKIAIENNQSAKWNTSFLWTDMGLVFAGAFDSGDSSDTYKITMSQDNNISFTEALPNKPSKIYEKYYLVDSAYAVTRKENVKTLCGTKLDTFKNDNDLLLFYNYRPWNSQTFCDGNVSLLAQNVNGFVAHQINGTIRLGIDMNQTVGNDTTKTVRLSKQKVVF